MGRRGRSPGHLSHSGRILPLLFPEVQPPEGKSRDCLLTVVLRDGSKTTLCAESEDDAV